MTVTTQNASYEANAAKWQRCRDAIEGRDAILKNGVNGQRFIGSLYDPMSAQDVYLPRLSGQTPAEYHAYCRRAAFFNATGRTVDALTGMIFGKDPMWSLPVALEAFEDDITLAGDSLRGFAYKITEEEIAVSRVGVLVDYPSASPEGMSMADAQRRNIRPFMRMYKAESIINWRETIINGARKLSLVVLTESVDSMGSTEFEVESSEQYRVLDLIDGRYRQRVFNEKDELLSEVYPTMRGQSMTEIPFRIVGGNAVRKPLLMDLVDTNLAHYRNSADYEHGLHFTGLPTPWVAGVQLDEGETLSIGSTSAWVFPDPSAKAEYLEFKGDGLNTLKVAMADKEQRMAVLGARMLSEDTRGAEAVGTMELRTASERSILAAVARDVSDAMRQCLEWMAMWVGANAEVEFALNTDYGAHRIEPQQLQQLVAAWQSDAITLRTLFENLQKGEIIAPDADYESYQTELDDQGPSIEAPIAAQDTSVLASLRARMGL